MTRTLQKLDLIIDDIYHGHYMTYMGLCSNNTPCYLIYENPTLYNYKGMFTQVEEAAQQFQYYIKYYWTEIYEQLKY